MHEASSASGAAALDSAAPEPRVRDVMRRDFIKVSGGESLREALELMRLARLRHLTIENDGVLVGILSYRDLQDALLARSLADGGRDASQLRGTSVVEHLTGAPFSIAPDATLEEAAARLERLRVGCLPVVELGEKGPRVVGLLTETDLLRAAFPPS
jgi:CBS domain-containing protein